MEELQNDVGDDDPSTSLRTAQQLNTSFDFAQDSNHLLKTEQVNEE